MASIATNSKDITILSHCLVPGCTRLRTANISGFTRLKYMKLAVISRVKNSRKIQPRVHVMRPAGTKRSTARMTNVTTRRLMVERRCMALTPLALRELLIRAKATQNPRSKERSRNRQDWAQSNRSGASFCTRLKLRKLEKINSAFGSFGPLNSLWFSRVAAQSGDDSLSKMSCGGVGINSKMPNQRDVYIESVKRNFADLQG